MSALITEVFDAEFRNAFEVPTSCVAHLPPARLNITRLVLCRNYRAGERDSCAMGANCKFVHADCDYSQLPTHSIHVHYVWRHEESCIYPRLDPGTMLHIYAPRYTSPDEASSAGTITPMSHGTPVPEGRAEAAGACQEDAEEPVDVSVMSECVLRTAGALALLEAQINASENGIATPPLIARLRHCPDFCWQRICKKGEDCPDAHVLYIDADAKDGSYKRAPVRPLPAGVRAPASAHNRKHTAAATGTDGATLRDRMDQHASQLTSGPHHGNAFMDKDRRRFSPLPAPKMRGADSPHHREQAPYAHVSASSVQMMGSSAAPPQPQLIATMSNGMPMHAKLSNSNNSNSNNNNNNNSARAWRDGLRLQWPASAANANGEALRASPNPSEANVLTPLQDSLSLGRVHMPTFHALDTTPPDAKLAGHVRGAAAQAAYAHKPGMMGGGAGGYAGHAMMPTSSSCGVRQQQRPQGYSQVAGGMDAAAREFYPGMAYSAGMAPPQPYQQQQQTHATASTFYDPAVEHMGRYSPQQQMPMQAVPHTLSGNRVVIPSDIIHSGNAVPAPRSSVSYRASPPPAGSGSLPSTPRHVSSAAPSPAQGPELSFRAHRLMQNGSVSNAHLSVTPNVAYLANSGYSTNGSAMMASGVQGSLSSTPAMSTVRVSSAKMPVESAHQPRSRQHEGKSEAAGSRMLMSASTLCHDGVPAMVLSVEDVASVAQHRGDHRGSRLSYDPHATANEMSGVLGVSEGALSTGRSRVNLSVSNLSTSKSVYRHNPYSHAEPRTILSQP